MILPSFFSCPSSLQVFPESLPLRNHLCRNPCLRLHVSGIQPKTARKMFLSTKVLVAQMCLILCNPMDYCLPGCSVHGILQAGILEWVAIPFSRGSSQPRDQTQVFCIAGRFFIIWATREDLNKQKKWADLYRLVPNRKRSTSRLYIVTLLV